MMVDTEVMPTSEVIITAEWVGGPFCGHDEQLLSPDTKLYAVAWDYEHKRVPEWPTLQVHANMNMIAVPIELVARVHHIHVYDVVLRPDGKRVIVYRERPRR